MFEGYLIVIKKFLVKRNLTNQMVLTDGGNRKNLVILPQVIYIYY